MKDLAQAALQHTEQGLPPLSAIFGGHGVSEITLPHNAEIFSIEQLSRTKNNLNTPIDDDLDISFIEHHAEILDLFRNKEDAAQIKSSADIKNAHVNQTNAKDVKHDRSVFHYGQDDKITEQSGGTSDANFSTAGGYLKKGSTIDAGAHEKNIQKKFTKQYTQALSEQINLNQVLDQIDAQIAIYQIKIADYNQEIAKIDDILNVINDGDINAQTASGQTRIDKLNNWAKENDINLQKFKNDDGSINKEKLQDHIVQEREKLSVERDDIQVKLDDENEIKERLENGSNNPREAYQAALEMGDSTTIERMNNDINTSELKAENLTAEDNFVHITKLEDTLPPVQMANETISSFLNFTPFTFDILPVNNINEERSHGSFAGSDYDQNNQVITLLFAKASDPTAIEQEIAPETPDYSLNNNNNALSYA